MSHKPPEQINPYQHLRRHELAQLAWGIIHELQEKRLRTAHERRELTQRVDWLLKAYIWLTHELDMVDHRLRGGAGFLGERYMEHYFIEERSLRHSVFKQAEGFVFGDSEKNWRWSVDTRAEGKSLSQHIYNSPDGLRLALSVLENIWTNI